jgi:hypothetical protein
VDSHHDLLEQRGGRRYVQPPGKLDHAVHHRPGCPAGASADVLTKGDESQVSLLCLTEAVDEVEARAPSSVSRLDSTSATVFAAPGL